MACSHFLDANPAKDESQKLLTSWLRGQLCPQQVTPTSMSSCWPQCSALADESQRVSAGPFPEALVLEDASQSIRDQTSQVTFRAYCLHLSASRKPNSLQKSDISSSRLIFQVSSLIPQQSQLFSMGIFNAVTVSVPLPTHLVLLLHKWLEVKPWETARWTAAIYLLRGSSAATVPAKLSQVHPQHVYYQPQKSAGWEWFKGQTQWACSAKFKAWAIQQHFGKGSGWHQTTLMAKNVNTAMTAAKSQRVGSGAEVHHHLKTAQKVIWPLTYT